MKATTLALSTLLAAAPLMAQEPAQRIGDDGRNLRFALSVHGSGAGAGDSIFTKADVVALALDGREVDLHTGWKLPFAVASTGRPATADDRPDDSTRYLYQHVGVSATISGRVVAAGRIRAQGLIEISATGSEQIAMQERLPQIGSISHEFEVMLVDGEGVTLAELPKPDGGTLSLVLAATIEE